MHTVSPDSVVGPRQTPAQGAPNTVHLTELHSLKTHNLHYLQSVENDQDRAGIAEIFLVPISQLCHDRFERLNMKQLNKLDPPADLHTCQIVRKPSLCSHTYTVQRANLANRAFAAHNADSGKGGERAV